MVVLPSWAGRAYTGILDPLELLLPRMRITFTLVAQPLMDQPIAMNTTIIPAGPSVALV